MKNAILIIIAEARPQAQDTGVNNGIFSKSPSQAYNEGWDRVFGKKEDDSNKKELN